MSGSWTMLSDSSVDISHVVEEVTQGDETMNSASNSQKDSKRRTRSIPQVSLHLSSH
jgi:hypothetical protein